MKSEKINSKKIHFIIILAIFSLFLYPAFANKTKTFYKIGVLIKRSPEYCLKKWKPTADYLSNHIKDSSFVIVPLAYNKIYTAVKNEEVDFLIVNPSVYVESKILYGAERIATLENYRIDKGCPVYGGVVFYRADRNDIKNYNDLKGMRFMAVDESSLGGWRAAWREFKLVNIDPYHDFAKLTFAGTHDRVVDAVRNGVVDAGCVRTDILETMAKEGKINSNDFKVIHYHKNMEECKFIDFKFKHSTRLYPEWTFARAKHTSREFTKKVSIALFSINPNDKAAITGNYEGWTTPLSYQEVRDCLKELRIGPYKNYGKFSLKDVITTYLYWMLGLFIFLLVLIIVIIYVVQLNRKMKRTQIILNTEIEERKHAENEVYLAGAYSRSLIEASLDPLVTIDFDGEIKDVNIATENITGRTREELIGSDFSNYFTEPSKAKEGYTKVFKEGIVRDYFLEIRHKNGNITPVSYNASVYRDKAGNVLGVFAAARDISRLKKSEEERIKLEKQLQQAQKLESIGTLAAGIAHEINTPIQFINDNTHFLNEEINNLFTLIGTYRSLLNESKQGGKTNNAIEKGHNAEQEIDLEYLENEIPKAIAQTQEGLARVTKIVNAMKDFSHFSHIDTAEKVKADINKAIESTITVSRNEWKYVAEMKTELDPGLPLVPCFLSDINQVVMNLIINAAHAISNVIDKEGKDKGTITITTRKQDDFVLILVADNGTGINEEIRDKIFDHFFTTKEIGKGTGQGLSMAYTLIVEKHGGKLTFETEMGKGTTFIISLPLL